MNAEVVAIDTAPGIDLDNMQSRAAESLKEVNKTGRRLILAYVGAWGFVYDRALDLYQGGAKLFANAEKRGESMEATLAKTLSRFERRAGKQVDTLQEQLGDNAEQITRSLGDAGETLEEQLEKQVERVLVNLGIPTRDRLERLNQEIDRLNAKLDEELTRQSAT